MNFGELLGIALGVKGESLPNSISRLLSSRLDGDFARILKLIIDRNVRKPDEVGNEEKAEAFRNFDRRLVVAKDADNDKSGVAKVVEEIFKYFTEDEADTDTVELPEGSVEDCKRSDGGVIPDVVALLSGSVEDCKGSDASVNLGEILRLINNLKDREDLKEPGGKGVEIDLLKLLDRQVEKRAKGDSEDKEDVEKKTKDTGQNGRESQIFEILSLIVGKQFEKEPTDSDTETEVQDPMQDPSFYGSDANLINRGKMEELQERIDDFDYSKLSKPEATENVDDRTVEFEENSEQTGNLQLITEEKSEERRIDEPKAAGRADVLRKSDDTVVEKVKLKRISQDRIEALKTEKEELHKNANNGKTELVKVKQHVMKGARSEKGPKDGVKRVVQRESDIAKTVVKNSKITEEDVKVKNVEPKPDSVVSKKDENGFKVSWIGKKEKFPVDTGMEKQGVSFDKGVDVRAGERSANIFEGNIFEGTKRKEVTEERIELERIAKAEGVEHPRGRANEIVKLLGIKRDGNEGNEIVKLLGAGVSEGKKKKVAKERIELKEAVKAKGGEHPFGREALVGDRGALASGRASAGAERGETARLSAKFDARNLGDGAKTNHTVSHAVVELDDDLLKKIRISTVGDHSVRVVFHVSDSDYSGAVSMFRTLPDLKNNLHERGFSYVNLSFQHSGGGNSKGDHQGERGGRGLYRGSAAFSGGRSYEAVSGALLDPLAAVDRLV